MFGGLLNTRVRAAESALQQGRLDDAFRVAIQPEVRGHRRGPGLLRRLADQLIERARGHFAADRFAEALHDLNLAEASNAPQDRIKELRAQIKSVADEAARQEHSRRDRLAQARRRMEAGSLQAGRRILEAASNADPTAEKMKRDIDMRDNEAADLFVQVERLVRDGQWTAAVERLSKAKSLDPHDPKCAKLEADLCARLCKSVRQSMKDGRVQRAADELACLGNLGQSLPARRELDEVLRVVRQAGDALRGGDYDTARQNVLRIQHLAPEMGWAPKAAKQLGAIDEMVTALRAGPLGAFENTARTDAAPAPPLGIPVRNGTLDETVAWGAAPQVGNLPERVLLLVDDGGSYLLLRKERVTLGRAATSHPADIAIFADLDDHHADIARVGDDYFLFSPREVEVGGRPTRHQLLRDGDRVVLGRKAKFGFRLPSRKSPSAALDLSDTSKLPNDVRRVVLFTKTAMIGYGQGFHIQCRMARNPLVLFERDGSLWVRLSGRGHTADDAVRLELGKTVEIDGVSMVAKAWSAGPTGARQT
ncbi:MAG: coiled-coil domain-containing protein 22 [bacterium]|nr:coiled-coil domain-containing protein 22 [bacterium]